MLKEGTNIKIMPVREDADIKDLSGYFLHFHCFCTVVVSTDGDYRIEYYPDPPWGHEDLEEWETDIGGILRHFGFEIVEEEETE